MVSSGTGQRSGRGDGPWIGWGLIVLVDASLKHRDGHAEKQRITEQSEGPDSEGDEGFVERGRILHDFAEGAWDESWDDEAHALLDPDADDGEDAGEVEPFEASAEREDQDDEGDEVHCCGGPYPWDEGVVTVESEEEIAGGRCVKIVGVKLLEDLVGEQKDVDDHGHLDDGSQGEQCLVWDIVMGDAADGLEGLKRRRRP